MLFNFPQKCWYLTIRRVYNHKTKNSRKLLDYAWKIGKPLSKIAPPVPLSFVRILSFHQSALNTKKKKQKSASNFSGTVGQWVGSVVSISRRCQIDQRRRFHFTYRCTEMKKICTYKTCSVQRQRETLSLADCLLRGTQYIWWKCLGDYKLLNTKKIYMSFCKEKQFVTISYFLSFICFILYQEKEILKP